jgi:peptidoglycan/xylan/chitin deacetylase (PgdA/CDA1 family)
LLFADGPYKFQQNIINEFAGSKGTFFLNGNNFGCIYDYADQIKAAHAAGWTIASHGYSHARMTKLSWDQIHNELWLVEQAMIKILGVKPIYFRPPYGEYNDLLMSALANRGYKSELLSPIVSESTLLTSDFRGVHLVG